MTQFSFSRNDESCWYRFELQDPATGQMSGEGAVIANSAAAAARFASSTLAGLCEVVILAPAEKRVA